VSYDVTRDDLPAGCLAIEASAGTGKTWTISHLVARLLLTEPQLELRQILVVTFTNAAADELAARIRRVLAACRAGGDGAADRLVALGEQALGGREAVRRRLDLCLAGLDELAVGTIHASCKRILERAAFACGEAFSADLAPDDSELVGAAVRDAWRARLWSDARLARLAAGWKIEDDIKLWQRWNRHPGTRIEPQFDLATVLDAVEAAAATVRREATPAAIADLRSWQWKSGKDPEPALRHLATGGDPLAALDDFTVLADPDESVFKKNHAVALTHPLIVACCRLVESIAVVRVAWLGWLCPHVAGLLRERQAVAGLWTQDDLLRRVRDALDRRPELASEVRRRWPVALIDEFQDTDPVQWEIFHRCYASADARLVLVGDPKQAIYRFRGADLDAYLQAIKGRELQRLTVNFRSDPRLVAAVQGLIGRTGAPFLEKRIDLPAVKGKDDSARGALDDGGAPLTVLLPVGEGGPPLDRTEVVASEIVALLANTRLGDRPVLPQDCAVLVRKGFQAREMQAALRARGVPASLAADGDVLDSPAAAELRRILTALARPRDATALRLALATRAWGLDAAAIAALVADDACWQTVADQVEDHHQRWQRHGLTAAIEAWDAAVGAAGRFALLADGERWLTDWRHAVEVLHAESAAARLRPAALLAWWDRRDAEDADSRRLRLEGDASTVRILTMHVAKGLEFPIVFCPYLGTSGSREDEGLLVKDAGGTRLVLGGPGLAAAEAQLAAEDDAEQLRLAYVALTRARVRCYTLWGMWDQKGHFHLPLQSALGWWLRPDDQEHAAWRTATGKGADGREALLAATYEPIQALMDAGVGISMRAARVSPQRWLAPTPEIIGDGLRRLPPEARARLDAPRVVTSFSGILGGEAGLERRHGDEPQLPATAEPTPPEGLRALARGADVGDILHKLLENWDFQADLTTDVAERFARMGIHASGPRQPYAAEPVAATVAALHALAALPITCDRRTLHLAAVPDRLRRAEWEFHLPLARVRPARVLALIEAHAAIPPALLAELPRLRETAPSGGFLKGFVDLLACADEAWWVLDWKSNHLGDRAEDYADDRLWPAMLQHGYLVQALLYLLALHRHLRHRLGAAYDWDRHVAGAAWIFLRGVDTGRGAWTWKPPLALVLALERELLAEQP